MSEVASAYVSLIPSFKGGAASMTRQLSPAADRAGKDAGKRFGLSFKGMLATAGIGLGAGAITGFLKDAVGAASDLSESTSKVGVVFGKQASQIMRASQTSATAMGLSKQAYIEAAGTLGNLLVSLDIAPRKAAGLSKQMVKLAGDMASFNNTSPEDALDALRSGLTGETEPLKRYGVNMNDATLHAQALKMGLIQTIKDGLTPQAKALAAQALIMRQTKTAQGDFARTSGGLANQQRILGAEFGNLKATIGTAFLPVVTDLTKKMTTDVVPAVSKFITEMQKGTGKGGEFVHVLKETAGVGKDILGFFNGLPGPVKKYGAELLIAAVALNKVNNLGRGLVASLVPAEAGMTRTARASYALGVGLRNLAGAAGTVAVIDGMKRVSSSTSGASTAMGILESTAGGAAAGFAAGGPIGAGIGAGAAIIAGLTREIKGSGDAFEQVLPTMTQYADTLNGVGAATSRATRALVLERLEKSGLLKQTQALNISDRDAVQAAMGNVNARKRVSAALADATAKGKNYQALQIANKLGAETTAINSSRVAQLKKNLALAGTAAEAKRIQDRLDRLGRTNANPRISLNAGDTVSKLNTIQGMIRDLTGKTHVVAIKGHVTGGVGALLGAGSGNRTVDPLADPAASGYRTGQSLMAGLMRGIDAKKGGLKKKISQLGDLIQQLDDKVSSLSDTRAGFLSTFSSDNLFGVDMGPKGGVASLIAFEQKQAQQATQLMNDIQAVIGMGLSKSLVTQLQSQGTSGAAVLHAIATGGAGNISTLNALDAQTQAALQAAGMKAGDFVRGGSVDADLAAAQRREELLKKILAALQKKEHQIVVHDKSGSPKKTAREVSRRQRWAGAR